MENQIQTFVLISSIFLGIFILISVYLVVKLKINDILLKRSEDKLKTFNETLQTMVTEKTRELRESEKRFRSLYELNKEILENSPAGMIKLDKNLSIEFENPEMKNIRNMTSEKTKNIKGRSIKDIPEFQIPKLLKLIDGLIKGNELTIETKFLDNGKKTYVEIKGVPIFENRKFAGAVLLFNDITKSIIAEEKLKQSFKILQKATEDVIQAMASTSEMRDPYTAGHQRRVKELAVAIGKEMGITKEQLEGVKFAGMIHDIGKISVPSDILSKPGKITEMEYEVIKSHCKTGYELLDKIKFPWPISKIVYQHHERMDGSGYPNGLVGNNIIAEARILAVADVVEAMTSHRPYRPALGIEIALEEIENNKNSCYDKDVVQACLVLFKNKNFNFTK